MSETTCVICGATGNGLCSSACLEAARVERNRNIARMRRLGESPAATQLRLELIQRNGVIINALISWRPQHSASPNTH